MTRAYLRLDPALLDHKGDYPDGAGFAFVLTLCLAEQQPKRGIFKSEKLLRVLLERRARWVPYLIEHGDLLRRAGGSLYVDGWDEWQEGDWKVHERVARVRNRRSNGVTPDTVTPATVPTVTNGTDATVLARAAEAVSGKRLAVSGGGAPLQNGPPNRGKAQPTDESPTSGLWAGRSLHKGQHIGCLVCEAVPGSAAEAARDKRAATR
jgi:hypothetical protein